MKNGRKPQPDIAAYQAALREIAAKGRDELRAEGKTDAEFDAEIDEALRNIRAVLIDGGQISS